MQPSIHTVRGGTRLVFDSIAGVTNTVEAMHRTIAQGAQPWAPAGGAAHGLIAAAVYAGIRAGNSALRAGVDYSLAALATAKPLTAAGSDDIRLLAALNGALGDHLEATGNCLAIPMTFTSPATSLPLDTETLAAAYPEASPHLVILIHGLGMSEQNWRRNRAPCLGAALQAATGATPLYLRYNTGRHISSNGRELARKLQELSMAWPRTVASISLIGHSMGGLVIRSACRYAQEARYPWLETLRRVVCLGTPHHGAPLAKMAHSLERLLQQIPYTEPLANVLLRSDGIRDLRHGSLLDEDWQGGQCERRRGEEPGLVPLLPGVEYYFAAASVGRDPVDPLGQLLGDLLVRPASATGHHRDEFRKLDVSPENCRVFHQNHHFDLLDDKRVQRQVIAWFTTEGES